MKMQHRFRTHVVTAASALGLFVAAPAHAASLTQVSDWGATGVPSYVKMYIYVPDKLADKPPILVSSHACMSNASGQLGAIPKIKAAADANGFIIILPDNPGRNCWDVGNQTSLKHDGGGDTQAIAQMVKYTLNKYKGDASRVYAMGGSSGAMLTQALMATYPDVFRAGHARAGVPAGCWADAYDSSMQWSGTCAKGMVSKTAQQWGDLVRAMYTGYTGHRPRIQIVQGDSDMTIDFKNSAESIKEWTNVLGLSATPSSTDSLKTSISTYSRQFWKNSCGYVVLETWAGKGGGHSMGYEEDDILKFFGLDKAGGADPETDCPPGGGTGTGGATSAGGSGGAGPIASGGSPSTGGTGPAAAGSGGSTVGVGTGGTTGVSGASSAIAGSSTVASGGTGVSGAPSAVAGSHSAAAGSTASGPAASGNSNDSGGCAFAAPSKSKQALGAVALGLSLLAIGRRRRRAQN